MHSPPHLHNAPHMVFFCVACHTLQLRTRSHKSFHYDMSHVTCQIAIYRLISQLLCNQITLMTISGYNFTTNYNGHYDSLCHIHSGEVESEVRVIIDSQMRDELKLLKEVIIFTHFFIQNHSHFHFTAANILMIFDVFKFVNQNRQLNVTKAKRARKARNPARKR